VNQNPTSAPSKAADAVWPTTCAGAQAVVFRLRRQGLRLPGVTTDEWASSVLSWASNGRGRRCVGVTEVSAA
jgi:hypothetical protein